MRIFKSLLLIGLVASSFACERLDVQPVTSAQSPVVQASRNLSLADVVASMDNASDIDFFRNTDITDHSERGNHEFAAKAAAGDTWAAKPKIKFLWHGTDPNSSGCKKPKGICIVITIGRTALSTDVAEVEAKAADGFLYLYFPQGVSSDFGVTSDGYLPVAVDLPIPNDVLAALGISNPRTFVKSGIYTASYNASEGRYQGVALELVER